MFCFTVSGQVKCKGASLRPSTYHKFPGHPTAHGILTSVDLDVFLPVAGFGGSSM